MQTIDHRYVKYFDWISFLLITIIASIGLLYVFSATYRPDIPYSIFFKKQLFGVISGIVIYWLCSLLDYRKALIWGYTAYIAVIGLLIITMIKGSVGMGAQRWIDLGFTKVQPSEFIKIFFPAFIVYYCCIKRDIINSNWKEYLPIIIPLFASGLLVLKQPDLGTAIVLMFSGLITLWLAGLSRKFFIVGACTLVLATPLLWTTLKPYQKQRIAVFLGQGDTQRERYQIEQAKIAVGSGGVTGKGILNGTQNTLSFLPEGRTDFIFAVLCEETGFLGALFVLLLYTILFVRLCWQLLGIRPIAPRLLAAGLIIPVVASTLINISMVLGLLPIVGIPLPLMSYGISQTWTTFACLGLFNSIIARRHYLNG